MQTINVQVNDVNDEHVHCSFFMNSTLLGNLVFNIGEYQIFGAALSMGCRATQGHLVDKSNDKVFINWTERGKT